METILEKDVVAGVGTLSSSSGSAVSWPAIFAGAVVAAALSLILFILGIGLGLGSMSPWAGEGASGAALGISSILWITFTSLVAAGLGGYLTGRLRVKWVSVHNDEVYFRDTAHGFLAWGVATLLTAVIFTSSTAGIISMGAEGAAAVAGGVADTAASVAGAAGTAAAGSSLLAGENEQGPLAYYLDSMFRTSVMTQTQATSFIARSASPGITSAEQEAAADVAATEEGAATLDPEQQAALSAGGGSPESMVTPRTTANTTVDQAPTGVPEITEVARIMTRAILREDLPQEDLTYVGRLVARHTGLSIPDAEERVGQMFTNAQTELRQLEIEARQAADTARATSAKIALWFFVTLLIGAFVASYSATIGGRQRDL